jgi:hypothetical protein
MDLQELVAHFLAGQHLPQGRESLLTVGSTERWIYGETTSKRGFVFIDNDTGAGLAEQGALDAWSVYKEFQRQLSKFAARYQR